MTKDSRERRSDSRTYVNEYYSVELSLGGSPFTFQFKIWNLSSKGMCILVRKDSGLFEHLRVGDRLKMKYYKTDASQSEREYILKQATEYLETEIKHITEHDEKHCFVGLGILENQE
jgi:hypothetical protein